MLMTFSSFSGVVLLIFFQSKRKRKKKSEKSKQSQVDDDKADTDRTQGTASAMTDGSCLSKAYEQVCSLIGVLSSSHIWDYQLRRRISSVAA